MSIRQVCHAGHSRRKVPPPKSVFPAWETWLGRRNKIRLTVAKRFAEGYLDKNLAKAKDGDVLFSRSRFWD